MGRVIFTVPSMPCLICAIRQASPRELSTVWSGCYDLASQIPLIHDIVRAMGWPLVMIGGVEADDVIGTLAVRASELGMQTRVSTGDKDMAQLVNDKVVLFNTMTRDNAPIEMMDASRVQEKFGVAPERIIDYLALVGDTVDNVPGVPKCGPKTAVKWLSEYGSLDGVISNADAVKGKVGENLRASLEFLPLGRELVTISTDVELPAELTNFDDGLSLADEDVPSLVTLFERAGFKTWLREVRHKAGSPEASQAALADDGEGGQFPATTAAQCVTTEAEFADWLTLIKAAELVAFDTETTSLNAMQAELVGLSMAIVPGQACYVPVAHQYTGVPDQLDRQWVLDQLRDWLQDPKAAKVGQNLKYDAHILANYGIALQGIAHDTLLQSYVLEAHRPHDMDALAKRHLNRQTITYTEVAGKGAKQIGFAEVALDVATEYAAEDADVTLQLHKFLFPQIERDEGLLRVYRDIELPSLSVLQTIERNGVLIDPAALTAQSQEIAERLQALEQQAFELAGQPFNLGSPKQLGEVLFGKLELPVVKKTASGQPSTDEEVLSKLAEDYPLPKMLLEHRSLAKLKSTYTDKLPTMIHPRTGRVHTNYAQATAVTGRLASTDPNLQNIPVRTVEGRRIREAFIAPPDASIVSCDYSQIELRIMAHISQDAGLVAAFEQGLDVHKATAAEVFSVPLDQVDAEQRRYAKVINFGLIYGMSAFGLAKNLNIERSAAASYIDRYFARYPGVADYMERTRALAKQQGYVETVFGRRLWLPEINSPNGPRRQGAERAAINAPMQGTAADLIKMAMVKGQRWLQAESMRSLIVMQVHDELVLEVPQDELATITEAVPRLMAEAAELRVPLLVEAGVGPNWEQAH